MIAYTIGIGVLTTAVLAALAAVRILREYERAVIFRLGRLRGARGPGPLMLVPFADRMERVSLRTITLTVPPQEVSVREARRM